MSHTNNPRETEDRLREAFSARASSYYPDDTPVPELLTDEGAAHRPIRSRFNQPKRGPILLAAASAVILALGATFAVKALSTSDDLVDISATQTPSPTNSVPPADASDAPLAHMKPDHDGPVLVVGHPILCPDAAPSDSGLRIPTEPTNPIDFCKKLNLLGKVDPDKAFVTTRVGWIFIEDRHPAAEESIFESPEAERAALEKESLPAGHTFTGVDYEMGLATSLIPGNPTGQCTPFDSVMQEVNDVIENVSRNTWVHKEVEPFDGHSNNLSRCTSVSADLRTRTILVKKPRPGAAPLPTRTQDPQWLANLEKMEAIEAAVNNECLTTDEALKVADQAVRDSGLKGTHSPVVRSVIPNGRECAKLYKYPAEDLSYVVFGQ